MKGWLTHVAIYVAVNAVLVLVWLISEGSTEELGELYRELADDGETQQLGTRFWPVWPMFGWGIGLAIRTAVFAVNAPGNAMRALRGERPRAELDAAPASPALHVGAGEWPASASTPARSGTRAATHLVTW